MNNHINVTKRDGRTQPFDLEKVHKVLEWATDGIASVSISEIELKANIQLFDKIPAYDIHELLIKSAAELISETTPNYQYVAARLVNYKIRKDVYGQFEPWALLDIVKENVKRGVYDTAILDNYTEDELAVLGSYIKHDRDNDFTYVGMEQFRGKYLVQDRRSKTVFESPQVLYITIEDDDSGCIEETEITLLVNPVLLFENVTIPYCDNDDDGFASIDLQSLDDTITGGNANFTVSYFEDDIDAQNNNTANQLPPFYNNTNAITTLYARIVNIDSGCSTVNPFEIEVLVAPSTNQPSDEIICDNDQDGFSIVNLETKIDETVPSRTGLNIDVFTSFDDADNNVNPILVVDRSTYNTCPTENYHALEKEGCHEA